MIDEALGAVVDSTVGQAIDMIVGYILGLIVGAIETTTNALIAGMEGSSAVSLSGPEFAALATVRAQVMGMSMVLVLGFLFINVMRSMAKGEPGGVIRAALVDLPAALLLTAMFTGLADIAIRIVDEVSAQMIGDVGSSVGAIGATLIAGNTVVDGGQPAGGLMAIIFAFLYIFGALLVWAELLVRSALIYIIMVTAPLGFAARASVGARQIARRTVEVMTAIILSKLGIAMVFAVGSAIIGAGTSLGEPGGGVADMDLSAMFVGTTVILLAAFMPWMVLKMIPVMASATEMGGAERAPLRMAAAGAGLALGVAGGVKMAQGGGSGAGSSGGSGPPPPTSGSGSGGGSSLAGRGVASGSAPSGRSSSGASSGGSVDDSVVVVPVSAPQPGMVTLTSKAGGGGRRLGAKEQDS